MKRKISVFIASPNDLSNERKQFKDAIHQLNVGFGDGANVEFVPLGWEDTLASTGRRSQGVINEDIDRCDVFILVMHRRWGQEAPDAKPYSSYTEEEFHRALERWKKDDVPEIFVFFKRVDAASEADPGPQLKKVIDFRVQLEETRQVLYHYFEDEKSFIEEVDRHLRAYAKDELPKAEKQREMIVLPLEALEETKKAKLITEEKIREAKESRDAEEEAYLKLEALQLQIAEDAANLSKEGKIEFARRKFAELVVETMDTRVLYLGYEFFYRTGDLNSAFSVLEKWLSLSGKDENVADKAKVYGNLGNVYQTRGDLDKAEEIYNKALDISKALGSKEGIAIQYGNLGIVYKIRGDLDKAVEMYNKALEINQALGCKEGMAIQYCNLGNVYFTRGDMDKAVEMYDKSLKISQALGIKEGMAIQYGNLGNVYSTRGDLEKAEEEYNKALEIGRALGRKEGMANQYGNLGNVYKICGDLDKAVDMNNKALEINQALGRKEGMASQYGNLGIIYKTRGDLDKAVEMYNKALEINQALGCKGGMASQYGNLGNVYSTRGDLDKAEKMYNKALEINQALGRKEGMASQYGNLGNVYKICGDLDKAEKMYNNSLSLFQEIGAKPMILKVQGLLKDLKNEYSEEESTK